MECDCSLYLDIELSREHIAKRIKQTKKIKKHIEEISKLSDGETILLKCKICEQYWQSNRAWNWGNSEYVFKIPKIDIIDWQNERYAAPDELMIHSSVMRSFFEKNQFTASNNKCRELNCSKMAANGLVFCLEHHINQLAQLGKLPKKPIGRLFPPYHIMKKV